MMSDTMFANSLGELMRNTTLWKVLRRFRKALRRFRGRRGLAPTGSSLEANYYIKLGYAARLKPAYCVDDPAAGASWQPMVYPFAAERAVQRGCETIVDLGCGNARKLARLQEENPNWNFIGVDYGINIHSCTSTYSFGKWIEADLEAPGPFINDCEVRNAIVICSDVIEHMISPSTLLNKIRSLLERGASEAVISTPERDLTHGTDDFGPPGNPCHVREWSIAEFKALLEAWEFHVEHMGLTKSCDAQPHEKTILAVVTL